MLTEPSLAAGAPAPLENRPRGALAMSRSTPNYGRLVSSRAAPPPGIDFGMLLRALLRALPILVVLAVLGAAIGFAVQQNVTPRYTSEVQLLLEPKSSNSFGADTQFGSMYVDGARIASVVSIIESSDLLTKVVDSEHLDTVAEFGGYHPTITRRLLNLIPALRAAPEPDTAELRRARALYVLNHAITVDRVGSTYVLTIQAHAADPVLAQRIANAVANTYLTDQVGQKTDATQRDSTWINARLDTVRAELQQSEDAADAIRRKYGLMQTSLGSGATMDRQTLTELNTQLLQTQADVAATRAKFEQVDKLRAGGSLDALSEAAGSQLIATLRERQADNARQLASLRAVYGANYPEVKRIHDEQSVIAQQIGAEVTRIAERRRADYQAAVSRQQTIQDQLSHAVATTDKSGDEGHEALRRAERIVEANQSLYTALLGRWREVQQQQTREDPEARIISQAAVPDLPSFPKRFVFPAGGAAALLFLGLGFTLAPPLLDRRFISVTSVEQRLGLPVLGAVPMLRRRDVGRRRSRNSIVEYTDKQPLSRFAESLRMLRTFLHIRADRGATVVHITSALEGEGKSTVAATLAASAAAAGVRTVLIDADLRSCTVSAMFGLRGEDGLTDILERGAPVRPVQRQGEGIPLAVLPAGSSPTPRPDVILSDRFTALLRELSTTYSLVIVDGPPVLPVSDALALSNNADTTIMVVQWRATPRDQVEQAVKLLRMVGAPLAGVILNKIDLSKVSQYEFGYPR